MAKHSSSYDITFQIANNHLTKVRFIVIRGYLVWTRLMNRDLLIIRWACPVSRLSVRIRTECLRLTDGRIVIGRTTLTSFGDEFGLKEKMKEKKDIHLTMVVYILINRCLLFSSFWVHFFLCFFGYQHFLSLRWINQDWVQETIMAWLDTISFSVGWDSNPRVLSIVSLVCYSVYQTFANGFIWQMSNGS